MSESALVRLPNRSISDAELTEAPVALPVEADDEVNVGELARKLWRRKWAILLTIVTLMVLTTVVVFQLTPIYRAETFVMLEARQAKVANIQEVLLAYCRITRRFRARSRSFVRATSPRRQLPNSDSTATPNSMRISGRTRRRRYSIGGS